eukprot:32560_1
MLLIRRELVHVTLTRWWISSERMGCFVFEFRWKRCMAEIRTVECITHFTYHHHDVRDSNIKSFIFHLKLTIEPLLEPLIVWILVHSQEQSFIPIDISYLRIQSPSLRNIHCNPMLILPCLLQLVNTTSNAHNALQINSTRTHAISPLTCFSFSVSLLSALLSSSFSSLSRNS